jgi:GNAT superfamily N-acetyltransferase
MAPPLPRLSPHVRQSTAADIKVIHTWLQRQSQTKVHGSFLCNWSLTRKCHEEGSLVAYIDPRSQEPVAYQWGGLIRSGILEVRNDMRGRGIGRVMVEHRLAQAAEAGEDILCIQCKPSTSIAFWKRMGFTLVEGDPANHAYRFMPRPLEMPPGGAPVRVTVEWFPEERKWKRETLPVLRQEIAGTYLEGRVHLSERAMYFKRINDKDTVLRVCVEGEEWYCDKAKYDAADDLGVEHCANGVVLDVVRRPGSGSN